jgi:uncharacterized membrane protein
LQGSKGRYAVHAFLALYAIILAYIIGGLIAKYNVPVDMYFALSFALLFFALAQSIYEIGLTKTLLFFIITSVVGFLAEVLGTSSGFPFGKYAYDIYAGSSYLGPEVLGVPEVVPLIWFVIVYICFSQTFGYSRSKDYDSSESFQRSSNFSRSFLMIALTAFGAMAWDVVVDPMFTSYGYWSWSVDNPGPKLYGVPLTNFAGWFAVSFLMVALILLAFSAKRGSLIIKQENILDSRIVYLLLMLDGIVANASLGNYLAIIFGATSMSVFFVAAVALGSKLKSENLQNEKTEQLPLER